MATTDLITVPWDIDEMVICSNINNVFGAIYTMQGAVKGTLEARVKSGEQMGGGGIYSVVSKMIGGTVTLQVADMQGFDALPILLGGDQESSDDEDIIVFPFGEKPIPFFSMATKTFLDDGEGNFVIFVPKLKITGNFTYSIADNEFSVPEFTATAVKSHITRAGKKKFAFPMRYSADTALTIPPTGLALT